MRGTFEDAPDQLIDHELHLSGFDAHYRNESTGGHGVNAGNVFEGGPGWLLAGVAQQPPSERSFECRQARSHTKTDHENCEHGRTGA